MGDVVGAVFNLRYRSRRKRSSTSPETPWSTTHPSINRSAWGSTQASSVRSESNAQGRFRTAQELREAKKKAQERGNRWDASKWGGAKTAVAAPAAGSECYEARTRAREAAPGLRDRP